MHGYFHSIFLVPKLFWYFVLGTCKFISPPWYSRGGGGGVDGTPSPSFWYVAVFQNDFSFCGKPRIFSAR